MIIRHCWCLEISVTDANEILELNAIPNLRAILNKDACLNTAFLTGQPITLLVDHTYSSHTGVNITDLPGDFR